MPKLYFKIPKINLTVQLILILLGALFLGKYIPLEYKSFFYACSLSLKEVLLFVLPFIIFSCLFYSMVAQQGRAIRFVLITLFTVCLSNFLSVLAAYGFGIVGFSKIAMSSNAMDVLPVLEPLWRFNLPSLTYQNEGSLILGLGLGIVFSLLPSKQPLVWSRTANEIVTLFLSKIFIPVLPLFALGFILKMEFEGILGSVLTAYAPVILLVALANLLYLTLMFGIAAKFKRESWFAYLKNVLPVGVLGFTTMSSLATMPVTLAAAEKNTQQPQLARAIIPATVNIHMVGDSLILPILAMGVLLTFGSPLPTLLQYLVFTQFFMLAKFAIPGVPCGTILVMLPVLERYFGFSGEMSAFIAAIYVLFDPFVTAGNVLGNSALVILISRWMQKVSSRNLAPAEIPVDEFFETN